MIRSIDHAGYMIAEGFTVYEVNRAVTRARSAVHFGIEFDAIDPSDEIFLDSKPSQTKGYRQPACRQCLIFEVR